MGLVRLFLALVVMVGHLISIYLPLQHIAIGKWINLPELGLNAGLAVIYFYVISGFLMSYTIAHNHPDDAGGLFDYYASRFVRIFSLYWPLFVIAFLIQPP
jgi:peptidoglycan/LPS O-acetylase OafA/YrhL